MKNILTFIAGITIGAIGGYIASTIIANKKIDVIVTDFQKRDQEREKNEVSENLETEEKDISKIVEDSNVSDTSECSSEYAYPIDESEYGELEEYNKIVVQYYCGNLIDEDGCALDDEKSAILPENIEKDINNLATTVDRINYTYSRNDYRKIDYEIEVIYEDE